MCCSFGEKCKNSPKTGLGCSTPLKPELVMSTPTYDPLGTETTYKSMMFLCQMGHKQIWTLSVLVLRRRYYAWGFMWYLDPFSSESYDML